MEILLEFLLLGFGLSCVSVHHQPNSKKMFDCSLMEVEENRRNFQVHVLGRKNDSVSLAENRIVLSEEDKMMQFSHQLVRLVRHYHRRKRHFQLYPRFYNVQL